MRKRAICLSVSKRNEPYLELIDGYSDKFNASMAETIFRIVREYTYLKSKNDPIKN